MIKPVLILRNVPRENPGLIEVLLKEHNLKYQIVKIGETAYGIQSHFELTDDLLESWIVEDLDLQKLDANQLRSDFESIKSDYQNTGRQLFSNFLTIAGLKNTTTV
jgi:GMP synthase-like glutamine amidotransferase